VGKIGAVIAIEALTLFIGTPIIVKAWKWMAIKND